jgi:hypothetical protein
MRRSEMKKHVDHGNGAEKLKRRQYKGLCVSCERRKNCTLQKFEKTDVIILFCEQYE